MPILDMQRRQTEVGRIRLGTSKPAVSKRTGKEFNEPVKLDRFRFTSPSQALIAQVAELYGGTPAEWQPQTGGAKQWEVITDARSLAVVVPPNAVSQWYEQWTGGHCTRRCDGRREVLSDKPCVCGPDPAERDCKPTTRISLMLAEVPGIGVWRLETHGYYAATELPAVAELLAAAGGYVAARLEIEERSAQRPKVNGEGFETRRWMVPVLHVDAAPAQLLALTAGAERPALAAAPAGPVNGNGRKPTVEELRRLLRLARTPGVVRQLWDRAKEAGIKDEALAAEMKAKGEQLQAQVDMDSEVEPAATVVGEVEPNRNETWTAILAAAGERGWNTSTTSQKVREYAGKTAPDCDGFELAAFLDALRGGRVTA